MLNDELNMNGSMVATLIRANGDVEVTRKDNIIVNGGFDFICNAMNLVQTPMGFIGVGTGVVAAAAADTALGTQLTRVASTYSHGVGTKVFTQVGTFAAGVATGAITEAGVFNAATLGIMLDRVTFAPINKGAADTLSVTFTFTLS